MSHSSKTPLLLGSLALAFFAGLLILVANNRIARGDFHPPYSTLRSDPLGLRVLHNALEKLPGIRVERSLEPASRLQAGGNTVLILPAVNLEDGAHLNLLRTADELARGGATVVILLSPVSNYIREVDAVGENRRAEARRREAERMAERDRLREEERQRRAKNAPRDEKSDPAGDPKTPGEGNLRSAEGGTRETRPILELLGLNVRTAIVPRGEELERIRPARRLKDAPAWAGDQLMVYGALRLETDPTWRPWFGLPDGTVVAERERGHGRIIVISDTYVLSNEALAVSAPYGFISALIGPARRVVFHESHLGVMEPQTLARLARSYGLAPAMLGALVCLALIFWRQASQLVPPPPVPAAARTGTNATGGFGLLLARALSPRDALDALYRAALELPARQRPPAARLKELRTILENSAWEKPVPAPHVLQQRLSQALKPATGNAPKPVSTKRT